MKAIGRVMITKFLMFVEYMKIFDRVSTAQDHERLQAALSNINIWCKPNAMELNAEKCTLMSFRQDTRILSHDYTLNEIE